MKRQRKRERKEGGRKSREICHAAPVLFPFGNKSETGCPNFARGFKNCESPPVSGCFDFTRRIVAIPGLSIRAEFYEREHTPAASINY